MPDPWPAVRAALVALALLPLLAPLGAPHASAQGGCTPCECGAAVCLGETLYWPVVEWVHAPATVQAGEPFVVTYRASWRVTGEPRDDDAPRRPTHLWYADLERAPPEQWTYQPPGDDLPVEVSTTLVWPTAGNLTLTAVLGDVGGNEGGGWSNRTTVHVLPPTATDGLRIPAPTGALALAVVLFASRRRNW